MLVRTLGYLCQMGGLLLRDVVMFRKIGRVDIVVLHKPAVQKELLANDLTPSVHCLEVLRRVGMVGPASGGFPALGSCHDDRAMMGRPVGEGGLLASLGRITLSHVSI